MSNAEDDDEEENYHSNEPSSFSGDDQITFLLDAISQDFVLSTAEVNLEAKLIDCVIQGHLDSKKWSKIHTQAVLDIIQCTKEVVVKFCRKTRLFQSLTKQVSSILGQF